MIAPAHRHPTQLTGSLPASTWQPMAVGGPAPIEHPLRTRHALGHALYLGGTSRQRGGAWVAARLRDDYADRHGHEFGSGLVALSLPVLHPAPFAVDQVVKGRHRYVEALGDLVGDRLGKLRLG